MENYITTLTMRIESSLKNKLYQIALKEKRSLSNFVNLVLSDYVKRYNQEEDEE